MEGSNGGQKSSTELKTWIDGELWVKEEDYPEWLKRRSDESKPPLVNLHFIPPIPQERLLEMFNEFKKAYWVTKNCSPGTDGRWICFEAICFNLYHMISPDLLFPDMPEDKFHNRTFENLMVRSMDRVNAMFSKGIGVRLTYRGLIGK